MFTNCETYHCSMLRHSDEKLKPNQELAKHLTISRKAKYPKIARDLDICTPVTDVKSGGLVMYCPHFPGCRGQ